MVPPRKASYRNDLFDKSALVSVEVVEAAVEEFTAIVNDTNIERILNELISQESPAVVRLVLAGLSKDLIFSCFPTTGDAFGACLVSKILNLLCMFFSFMEGGQSLDLHEEHLALVKEAPGLLDALKSQLSTSGSEQQAAAPTKRGKATSQKKIKAARRAQNKPTLDPAPFERLDLAIPETPEEVERCVEAVLATQRSILDAYLEALQLPNVIASLKAAVLPAESTDVPDAEQPHSSEEITAVTTPQLNDYAQETGIYSVFPSIRFSSLYRKRATEFGEWEINITPRAEKDLRQYSRTDRRLFRVIVHKMRDLSNGIFSADNHKQINGESLEVPIYAAMVTEDLRLVYQIDCSFVYDKENEQQTIKIFGMYREAQLTKSTFWNSMSRELGKRGQQYKDRCTLREPSVINNDTFVPATFPVQGEARFTPGTAPDLPSDDAEQIQSLLLKTVRFSQELLNNILEDRDVAVVLEISPGELNIIEHPHSCYVIGRSGTGKSTTIIYKMLMVEAYSELAPPTTRKIRQMFVCKSSVLAEKVGAHFEHLLRGYRPVTVIGNVKASKKVDRLLVAEEDKDWRSDLPKKFSDLEDADFPLFVSFEHLCCMIENDMLASSSVSRKATITYDKFQKDYWAHFPELLRKGLEPSTVFSEFLGVILGSEGTLNTTASCLDRKSYLQLSDRRQFVSQREQIYDLFETYLSKKRQYGESDAAQRTHSILEFFTKNGVPGRKIDYLYVDEAQDNLLIDALLLRSLCHNPNGLFWAGDTAQTIAAGSSFRFNELKAFLHRTESKRQQKHPELNFHLLVPPHEFQLTVNYRSQTRIVDCARTIIETLTEFWPESIDKLQPERGTVDGLRPIFFTNWDSENTQSKQFLFGNESSDSTVFGAHQCILVRDEAAKKELEELVGEIGIVMTLYESKGLEFNDVLLYNFFADSAATEAQWRIVLNLVADGPPAPTLDSMRHAIICSELKFLYVAITRARNNIWIADCSTKGEPMRLLWTSRDQIQNCVLGVDTPRFAISSTREEWQQQARTLFDNERYSQARLCFARAYMPHEAAVAEAYHLFKEASGMPANIRRQIAARKIAFGRVAALFRECARNGAEKAVQVYYRKAGECFEEADDVDQAIAAYTSARSFGRVAQLSLRSKKIDEAVATVEAHKQDIEPDLVEKVIAVARIFYFNKGHIGKARKLFPGDDDALTYLEERGMDCERAAVLESSGDFSAAAEIHLTEGRTSEAIALFLQDQNIERAGDSVLHELWAKFPFGVLPNAQDRTVMPEMIGQLDVSALNPSQRAEISMFLAIVNQDWPKLPLLAQSFLQTNKPAALLSLDHYFAHNQPNITTPKIEDAVSNLRLFLDYVFLLHNVTTADPCISINTRKLLGYKKEAEDRFLVPTGTFLRSTLSTPSGASDVLSSSQLRELFQESLRQRMFHRIREENATCRSAKEFAGPCPRFALFNGQCNHFDCRQEHILPSALDRRQYNLRLRMHLLQILIYKGLTTVETGDREFWLSRLYTLLNPLSYQLGSVASLDLTLIPLAEFRSALQIVKEWVRDGVYSLQFHPEAHFLTRFVHLAQFGFQFDAGRAMSYLTRASILMDPKKPLIYRAPPDGRYVVNGYIHSLDDQHVWSLSAGIDFFGRIISSKLTIQMNLLCAVAERLCTGLVIADCLARSRSLHGVTLPRSWLVNRSLTAGGLVCERDTNSFWIFARALATLLEPICSGNGAGHLLYDGEHLGRERVHFIVKETFLSRIMRCLCLLAYNFRNQFLRDFVWQSIHAVLWNPTRRFTPLCSRYVNARQWAGLTYAVRASTSGSEHDEMVQMVHTSGYQPMEVEGVRQIRYTNPTDLPRLLGCEQWMVLTPHSREQPESDMSVRTGTAAHSTSADEEEPNDERQPEDVAVELPAMPEPEPRSEEEMVAATKIYQAITQASNRRKERREETKSSITSAILEFFTACRGTSLTMNKAQQTYRLLFCGPFPHLLWCLASALTKAQAESQKIQARLSSPDNDVEELEKLDKERLDVERAAKQLAELRRVLNPAAEMHGRRIVGELKTESQKADALLRSLPFEMPSIFFRHLNIAYKGILQPRAIVAATRRMQAKPKLNTYDEMY
ncbi:UvrD-like helicase ATP-binding domain-containing protein [Favolaschia claudopus]|uniref:UvrD-like helicase ATP-binding domain-containing protein n=1 Tax=Favolaschia claudopus TaxID=2862362 RepID=A0AAW0EJK2_9AGAR